MIVKEILRLGAIAVCSVSLLTLSAKADVSYAIGASGNLATFDTSGTEREGNSSNTNSSTETASTSVSEDVIYGSIFAELVQRNGQYGVTLGAAFVPGEAELGAKSRTDTTTDGNETNQDDSTYKATAEVSDYWEVYLEPTYYIDDNTGIFVKGAFSQVTVNTLESISSGTDSSAYGNVDVDGVTWGVGVRHRSDNGLLTKLEYYRTEYDSITLDSSTGNKNRITADVEQEAVKLSIGYQF